MLHDEVYKLGQGDTLTVKGPGTICIQQEDRRKGVPPSWWRESANGLVSLGPRPRRRKTDERRSIIPRRIATCAPIIEGAVYGTQMVGRRKALFNRRFFNGVRESVGPDFRTERRDLNRTMYQYKTSRDPRIRALERRGGAKDTPSAEPSIFWHTFAGWLRSRRTGEDRRKNDSTSEMGRRSRRRGKG